MSDPLGAILSDPRYLCAMSNKKQQSQDWPISSGRSVALPDWPVEFSRWDIDLPDWSVDLSTWDIDLPDWPIEFPRWDIDLPDWSALALSDW